jgi:hypothetical protein
MPGMAHAVEHVSTINHPMCSPYEARD